jgi:hypothetical protein
MLRQLSSIANLPRVGDVAEYTGRYTRDSRSAQGRICYGDNISLRLGDELLDIVPVQRNGRLGAIEQNPKAAVKAADPNNSTFLFGKPWTTRCTECAHPKSSPYHNG